LPSDERSTHPRQAAIAVLPPDVSERIAAGEVIERPASVVRELVDNALDAEATHVAVELRGGGLELIRVADDGHGIRPDEVELAFARHATSKLRTWDDLYRLETLGFRGEALPSIASVAEVTMATRYEAYELGVQVTYLGSEAVKAARIARQPGSTVTVRHLFHNVPARLKFLPAERHEALQVGHMLRRYALAHPAVRFTLLLDGRASFQSSGSGDPRSAVADVYGTALAETMRPLDAGPLECAALDGLFSGRAVHRPSRQHVTLVINGRVVANRGIGAALEDAYRPHLPRGRHPVAVVRIQVPPRDVDPNVHPAKTEVKLAREQVIAARLAEAVREIVGRAPAEPPAAPAFALSGVQLHLPAPRRKLAEFGPVWADATGPEHNAADAFRGARVLGQLQGSLIVAEVQAGLLVVDQHRAHERLIYERLLRQLETTPSEGQSLLEPLVVELKPAQAAVFEQRVPLLERLGFVCERFGSHEYLVRAIPALDGRVDLAPQVHLLLEEASSAQEGWRERLMVSLACRAAVRRHRLLADAEQRRLVRDLSTAAVPAACPHGSPILLRFSGGFLERQFGW
jgi:DNA mismatch repair protein MutL